MTKKIAHGKSVAKFHSMRIELDKSQNMYFMTVSRVFDFSA